MALGGEATHRCRLARWYRLAEFFGKGEPCRIKSC